MTDEELIEELREMGEHPCRADLPMGKTLRDAADRIEQLEREKAVVSDLWEQQKEIALGYLTDCNKASERIEALRLAVVHYDAALKSSWPYGAKGDAWEHWNEARIILQEAGETFTHPDNQTPSE